MRAWPIICLIQIMHGARFCVWLITACVLAQATALLRTAMSTIVREGGDLSCGIFDQQVREQ